MAQKRFYGVKNHPEEEKNGVYDSWSTCSEAVKGASGVQYKGFGTREEAEAFCLPEAMIETGRDKNIGRKSRLVVASPIVFDASKAMNALDYLKDCEVMEEPVYQAVKDNIKKKELQQDNEKQVAAAVADPTRQSMQKVEMYVDGSYNDRNDRVGFGIYIQGVGSDSRGKGPETVLCGSAPMANGGRNVEGEVTAAWVGLSHLKKIGATNLPITVYHDYEGIGKWADGTWRANKDYTKAYADLVDGFRSAGMDVTFSHVDGHTGVEGNEIVDRLAKRGCEVHFPKEADFVKEFSQVQGFRQSMQLHDPVHVNPAELKAQMEDEFDGDSMSL